MYIHNMILLFIPVDNLLVVIQVSTLVDQHYTAIATHQSMSHGVNTFKHSHVLIIEQHVQDQSKVYVMRSTNHL